MAYTFEELEKWWPGKTAPQASVTMTITQEDGRSAHAHGYLNVFDPKAPDFSGQIDQTFNDRMRRLTYTPPGIGFYLQMFDQNGQTDPANIRFTKTGVNRFELQLTLLKWGNSIVTLELRKSSHAKVYVGWGATIGAGTGKALYALSINSADAKDTPTAKPPILT